MTNYLLIAAIAFSLNVRAQNKINFTYDAVGNQTLRDLICVNCSVPSASRIINNPQSTDFTESPVSNDVRYYPNPVAEKLHIEWTNIETAKVLELYVYSQAGQLLLFKDNLESSTSTVVEFQNFAAGIYMVSLHYNNNETKTLNIVKK